MDLSSTAASAMASTASAIITSSRVKPSFLRMQLDLPVHPCLNPVPSRQIRMAQRQLEGRIQLAGREEVSMRFVPLLVVRAAGADRPGVGEQRQVQRLRQAVGGKLAVVLERQPGLVVAEDEKAVAIGVEAHPELPGSDDSLLGGQ